MKTVESKSVASNPEMTPDYLERLRPFGLILDIVAITLFDLITLQC